MEAVLEEPASYPSLSHTDLVDELKREEQQREQREKEKKGAKKEMTWVEKQILARLPFLHVELRALTVILRPREGPSLMARLADVALVNTDMDWAPREANNSLDEFFKRLTIGSFEVGLLSPAFKAFFPAQPPGARTASAPPSGRPLGGEDPYLPLLVLGPPDRTIFPNVHLVSALAEVKTPPPSASGGAGRSSSGRYGDASNPIESVHLFPSLDPVAARCFLDAKISFRTREQADRALPLYTRFQAQLHLGTATVHAAPFILEALGLWLGRTVGCLDRWGRHLELRVQQRKELLGASPAERLVQLQREARARRDQEEQQERAQKVEAKRRKEEAQRAAEEAKRAAARLRADDPRRTPAAASAAAAAQAAPPSAIPTGLIVPAAAGVAAAKEAPQPLAIAVEMNSSAVPDMESSAVLEASTELKEEAGEMQTLLKVAAFTPERSSVPALDVAVHVHELRVLYHTSPQVMLATIQQPPAIPAAAHAPWSSSLLLRGLDASVQAHLTHAQLALTVHEVAVRSAFRDAPDAHPGTSAEGSLGPGGERLSRTRLLERMPGGSGPTRTIFVRLPPPPPPPPTIRRPDGEAAGPQTRRGSMATDLPTQLPPSALPPLLGPVEEHTLPAPPMLQATLGARVRVPFWPDLSPFKPVPLPPAPVPTSLSLRPQDPARLVENHLANLLTAMLLVGRRADAPAPAATASPPIQLQQPGLVPRSQPTVAMNAAMAAPIDGRSRPLPLPPPTQAPLSRLGPKASCLVEAATLEAALVPIQFLEAVVPTLTTHWLTWAHPRTTPYPELLGTLRSATTPHAPLQTLAQPAPPPPPPPPAAPAKGRPKGFFLLQVPPENVTVHLEAGALAVVISSIVPPGPAGDGPPSQSQGAPAPPRLKLVLSKVTLCTAGQATFQEVLLREETIPDAARRGVLLAEGLGPEGAPLGPKWPTVPGDLRLSSLGRTDPGPASPTQGPLFFLGTVAEAALMLGPEPLLHPTPLALGLALHLPRAPPAPSAPGPAAKPPTPPTHAGSPGLLLGLKVAPHLQVAGPEAQLQDRPPLVHVQPVEPIPGRPHHHGRPRSGSLSGEAAAALVGLADRPKVRIEALGAPLDLRLRLTITHPAQTLPFRFLLDDPHPTPPHPARPPRLLVLMRSVKAEVSSWTGFAAAIVPHLSPFLAPVAARAPELPADLVAQVATLGGELLALPHRPPAPAPAPPPLPPPPPPSDGSQPTGGPAAAAVEASPARPPLALFALPGAPSSSSAASSAVSSTSSAPASPALAGPAAPPAAEGHADGPVVAVETLLLLHLRRLTVELVDPDCVRSGLPLPPGASPLSPEAERRGLVPAVLALELRSALVALSVAPAHTPPPRAALPPGEPTPTGQQQQPLAAGSPASAAPTNPPPPPPHGRPATPVQLPVGLAPADLARRFGGLPPYVALARRRMEEAAMAEARRPAADGTPGGKGKAAPQKGPSRGPGSAVAVRIAIDGLTVRPAIPPSQAGPASLTCPCPWVGLPHRSLFGGGLAFLPRSPCLLAGMAAGGAGAQVASPLFYPDLPLVAHQPNFLLSLPGAAPPARSPSPPHPAPTTTTTTTTADSACCPPHRLAGPGGSALELRLRPDAPPAAPGATQQPHGAIVRAPGLEALAPQPGALVRMDFGSQAGLVPASVVRLSGWVARALPLPLAYLARRLDPVAIAIPPAELDLDLVLTDCHADLLPAMHLLLALPQVDVTMLKTSPRTDHLAVLVDMALLAPARPPAVPPTPLSSPSLAPAGPTPLSPRSAAGPDLARSTAGSGADQAEDEERTQGPPEPLGLEMGGRPLGLPVVPDPRERAEALQALQQALASPISRTTPPARTASPPAISVAAAPQGPLEALMDPCVLRLDVALAQNKPLAVATRLFAPASGAFAAEPPGRAAPEEGPPEGGEGEADEGEGQPLTVPQPGRGMAGPGEAAWLQRALDVLGEARAGLLGGLVQRAAPLVGALQASLSMETVMRIVQAARQEVAILAPPAEPRAAPAALAAPAEPVAAHRPPAHPQLPPAAAPQPPSAANGALWDALAAQRHQRSRLEEAIAQLALAAAPRPQCAGWLDVFLTPRRPAAGPLRGPVPWRPLWVQLHGSVLLGFGSPPAPGKLPPDPAALVVPLGLRSGPDRAAPFVYSLSQGDAARFGGLLALHATHPEEECLFLGAAEGAQLEPWTAHLAPFCLPAAPASTCPCGVRPALGPDGSCQLAGAGGLVGAPMGLATPPASASGSPASSTDSFALLTAPPGQPAPGPGEEGVARLPTAPGRPRPAPTLSSLPRRHD
ncbi:hypothetical protein PAPYR_3794 [Paratrimastix pyriformis]|uniref:Uncharacterized protein n=1 Tax=Paratrimastix pyriformis TaxID=342808 RepID=A0ABQ8UMN5_9EUKA|nr:hypothetical protein PAPYR_3794 [Paratrimastix pyriformis]